MKQKRTSIAAVLVVTAIMVPTGLPLRAQDSSDAAIERGKRMILSGDYARAAQVLRQAAKQLERLEDVQFFAAESNLGRRPVPSLGSMRRNRRTCARWKSDGGAVS